VSEDIVIVTLL